MSRLMNPLSDTAVCLSGEVGTILPRHAADRCVYFFRFAIWLKVLVKYVEIKHQLTVDPRKLYEDHATHQIDTGFRQKGMPDREVFDKHSSGSLNITATSATSFFMMELLRSNGPKGEWIHSPGP